MKDFKLMLAPMEGRTAPEFRELCYKNGADSTFTEMARVDGLARNNKSTLERIKIPKQIPTYIQIIGVSEPELKKFLKKFDVNPPIGQVFLDPPPIAGPNTTVIRDSSGGESFSSKGFKITPEFREAVIKKGIPTFALPPIISYGALNSMGENENGDQM